MLKKIIEYKRKLGIKKTCKLFFMRIKQLCNKLIIICSKHSLLSKEWNYYWVSYNLIKTRYTKKIKKMQKTSGTNKFSNIVWWCWLQGEDHLPELQKECLESLKRNLIDRKIIIITNDNVYDYIELPEYIKYKYEKGLISHAHFSDLIRLQLLIKYGGTWIDSTTYCTGYDKALFDKPLFVYKNLNYIWYANRCIPDQEPIIADNWFITSEIANPILVAVRDLLFDYWKNYDYVIDYFIFHLFFTLVVNYKYKKEFHQIILRPHIIPHMLQYELLNDYDEQKYNDIVKTSTMHKLTNKIDINNASNNSFWYHIIRKENTENNEKK